MGDGVKENMADSDACVQRFDDFGCPSRVLAQDTNEEREREKKKKRDEKNRPRPDWHQNTQHTTGLFLRFI